MSELFPYTHKHFDRDGLNLAYIDEGRGDPVVMVHGNPTWSFYYRALIATLSADHRCIVPDHIGCGRSDKPDDQRYHYTLDSRVEDLTDLLSHLGIRRRITLVVHDWGGMIGMAYAVQNPEAVDRIVVLNTAAFGLPRGKTFPPSLALTRTRLGEYLVLRHNAFCRGAARYCVTRKMTPAVRAGYLEPYDTPEHRLAVLRFVQDIPLKPSDPAWLTVENSAAKLHTLDDKPMLICWGEKDFVFDHHFLAEWRRRFPRAEVATYPRAGHYVLEDASDEIVRRTRRFFADHPLPKREELGVAV